MWCRNHLRKCLLTGSAAAALSFGILPSMATAQSQGDNASVADAARRAREQKKNAAKPARTLTNDDLPAAAPDGPQSASAPAGAREDAKPDQAKPGDGSPGVPDQATAPADALKKKTEAEAALKRAKAELAQAQGELDILQRKAALDKDSFYSQTDYARDTEGQAKLDSDGQQVNDKKAQVDDLKARIAALEAQIGESAEPEKPAQPL
jgi:hypothetical protein